MSMSEMRLFEAENVFVQPTELTGDEQRIRLDLEQEISSLQIELKEKLPRKDKNHKQRRLRLLQSRLRMLENGDYGRRIPDSLSMGVVERDKNRDFGRPQHSCEGVRPPHHIKHFETFKGSQTRENPHTEENLEAPCQDCHKLAHAMEIQSGISIEDFFRSFTTDEWRTIELLWSKKRISELKKFVHEKISSKTISC